MSFYSEILQTILKICIYLYSEADRLENGILLLNYSGFCQKCGVQKFSGHIKWKFISKIKDKKMEDKFFLQVGVRHLYPMRSM